MDATVTTKKQDKRAIKDAVYEQIARVSKALASPKRLELVALLTQSPKSVEELVEETGISMKLASAHLRELRLACLVETERQGKRIIYRVASGDVAAVWVRLHQLAEDRLAELQSVVASLGEPDGEWRSETRGDLIKKAKAGDVILLDVRPGSEFAYGHLPHARSIPYDELKARLGELPSDRPIIAYCRGPYCLFAKDAVDLLNRRGYSASQLREGTAEWAA